MVQAKLKSDVLGMCDLNVNCVVLKIVDNSTSLIEAGRTVGDELGLGHNRKCDVLQILIMERSVDIHEGTKALIRGSLEWRNKNRKHAAEKILYMELEKLQARLKKL